MSAIVASGDGSPIGRSLELARRFVEVYLGDFKAAHRKRVPAHRMFVISRHALWTFLQNHGAISDNPVEPAIDQTERDGRLGKVRLVLRNINAVASNPANVTSACPMFRIVNKRTEYHVELGDAFAPNLNIEPLQKASRFLNNSRKIVRLNGKRAAKYPEMPGSAEIMHTSELIDLVMDEVGSCLMNVARRMSAYRVPPPPRPMITV